VAEVSTSRKAVVAAQVATRVAARAARRSRLLGAAWSGLRATAVSLGRVVHRIWLEITGIFFLVFALAGGYAAWREYPVYKAGHADLLHLLAPALFSALFTWFALTSFWRANKKSGSRA
jgi:hypothetical protein